VHSGTWCGKTQPGTIPDIGLDLLPLIVFLYFLARSANGTTPAKVSRWRGFAAVQRSAVLAGISLLALADVAALMTRPGRRDDRADYRPRLREKPMSHSHVWRGTEWIPSTGVFQNSFTAFSTAERSSDESSRSPWNRLSPLACTHDLLEGRTGIANAGVGVADGENVMAILDHLAEVIVQLASV